MIDFNPSTRKIIINVEVAQEHLVKFEMEKISKIKQAERIKVLNSHFPKYSEKDGGTIRFIIRKAFRMGHISGSNICFRPTDLKFNLEVTHDDI